MTLKKIKKQPLRTLSIYFSKKKAGTLCFLPLAISMGIINKLEAKENEATTAKICKEQTLTNQITTQILQTKKNIEQKGGDYVFLAFWDFDGTLLKGDCSEGMSPQYVGLAQKCIEAGYSKQYRGKNAVKDFFTDYRYMEHHTGKYIAYPYIVQILSGTKKQTVQDLGRSYFQKVLSHYYFQSSFSILQTLEKAKVKNYIISASGDLFVDCASQSLGLPENRFHGIEVKIKKGIITNELIYPITWNTGKTEKLLQLVKKEQEVNPGKKIVVLAGFGNSYGTDGAFLSWIAHQTLIAGKPLSVMINGGNAPKAYQNIFKCVTFSEVHSPQ